MYMAFTALSAIAKVVRTAESTYFSMIGDMPAPLQIELLRVRGVAAGRNRDIDIDVRIFCDPPRPAKR